MNANRWLFVGAVVLNLVACGGGAKGGNSGGGGIGGGGVVGNPSLSIAMETVSVQGDMLSNQSLRYEIGNLFVPQSFKGDIYYGYQLQHPSVLGSQMLVDEGQLYLDLFLEAGFSRERLDLPTQHIISTAINFCLDNMCNQHIAGSPKTLTVQLNYTPTLISDAPERLTYSSELNDNRESLTAVEWITLNNPSTQPVFGFVTSFSDELLLDARLTRDPNNVHVHQLTLPFIAETGLQNKLHTGHVSLAFCYDRHCEYPLYQGERDIQIHYEQVGEPYIEYPELKVTELAVPEDFKIDGLRFYLAEQSAMVGYRYEEGETKAMVLDLESLTMTEQWLPGSINSASYSERYLVVPDFISQNWGIEYQHDIYRVNDAFELELVNQFTSPTWFRDPIFIDDTMLVSSSAIDEVYRFDILGDGEPVTGVFTARELHFLETSKNRIYNVVPGEHGFVERWLYQQGSVEPILPNLLFTSDRNCWSYAKSVGGNYVINRCSQVFQTILTEPGTEEDAYDFAELNVLPVPETHRIRNIAEHPDGSLFVVVAEPLYTCNAIQFFCRALVQVYRSEDRELIQTYGWPAKTFQNEMDIHIRTPLIVFSQTSKQAFVIEPQSMQETARLYRLDIWD